MENKRLLLVAMAERCRSLINAWVEPATELPRPLQRKHLLWMCDQIESHAERAAETKLHRWIGFVQCAMLANGILDLPRARAMFDNDKIAHGDAEDDPFDLLNPDAAGSPEIGGEG